MSVEKRISVVNDIQVGQIGQASIMHLGDGRHTELRQRTIALQRMIPNYRGDETRFAEHSLFFRPLLQLSSYQEVLFDSKSPGADIRVGSIEAKLVAASGLLRIGSGESLTAVSRIKHIRQFNG